MISTPDRLSSVSVPGVDRGDAQVVPLRGYLGNDECERVAGELAHLLKEGHTRIILDCSSLTFITSAGLARLCLTAHGFRRKQGVLQLAGLRAFKRKLAEAAGFDPTTELLPDLDSASNSLPMESIRKPKS